MVKQIEYHIFLRADANIQTPQVATLGFVTFGALRHDKLRFYTFLYCVILKTTSAMSFCGNIADECDDYV
jgi:hypothetical protein